MSRAAVACVLIAGVLQTLAGTPAWSQQPARPRSLPGAVVKVLSGDTLHVFVNGEVERVRYIGVSSPEPGGGAPETGEPLGREALRFNHGLTYAKNVRLELDVEERDPEGRLLAYVWLGDVMANAEMIGQGLGQVVTGTPNVRHQETLLRRQEQARAAKMGIWKVAGLATPPSGGTPAPAAAPKTTQARPGVEPKGRASCPLTHPIKADFHTYSSERCIYYVPSSPAYLESRSERCYATEAEARQDGCRRSRR
ncbi:MAG: thermonuclease family protein [Candidatus Rokuibacteriota bacterium]